MRVIGMDFLRGMCALGVAVYHMTYWGGGPHFHTVGLYGVYVFFVLSGASLFVAYRNLASQDDIADFLLARLLRIVPLIAAVALFVAWRIDQPIELLFLDATLLFGLGAPGYTSIVAGGWSLGIEFVFYLAFPAALAIANSRAWWLVGVLLFIGQRLYIDHVLAGNTLANAWRLYTLPLSFVFYFFAGCCLGRAITKEWLKFSRAFWIVSGTSLVVLMLAVPVRVAEDALIGQLGVALTVAATLLTVTFAHISGGKWLTPISKFLGDVSYGVYLIHPCVWDFEIGTWARATFQELWAQVAVCLAISVLLAWASNRWFEMPIRNLRRRRARVSVLGA